MRSSLRAAVVFSAAAALLAGCNSCPAPKSFAPIAPIAPASDQVLEDILEKALGRDPMKLIVDQAAFEELMAMSEAAANAD